jgi:hypothetical protein
MLTEIVIASSLDPPEPLPKDLIKLAHGRNHCIL